VAMSFRYFFSKLLKVKNVVDVVRVTKKGQIIIPVKLREKYGIKNRLVIEDNEDGLILKPLPAPSEDFGSLKGIFKGKTAREPKPCWCLDC
jgi:AbrB family looped-hinge helix DNA binding protein